MADTREFEDELRPEVQPEFVAEAPVAARDAEDGSGLGMALAVGDMVEDGMRTALDVFDDVFTGLMDPGYLAPEREASAEQAQEADLAMPEPIPVEAGPTPEPAQQAQFEQADATYEQTRESAAAAPECEEPPESRDQFEALLLEQALAMEQQREQGMGMDR